MKIDRMFVKYGRKMSIIDCSGHIFDEAKCFLQPLRYKNKMYLEGIPTEIGMSSSDYYLLLAPASFKISSMGEHEYISDGINRYHADRCEDIYFGEKVHFKWAILRQCIPDTYPAYNHFV